MGIGGSQLVEGCEVVEGAEVVVPDVDGWVSPHKEN